MGKYWWKRSWVGCDNGRLLAQFACLSWLTMHVYRYNVLSPILSSRNFSMKPDSRSASIRFHHGNGSSGDSRWLDIRYSGLQSPQSIKGGQSKPERESVAFTADSRCGDVKPANWHQTVISYRQNRGCGLSAQGLSLGGKRHQLQSSFLQYIPSVPHRIRWGNW